MIPTRKVSVGAVAGAASGLIVWALTSSGKTVPPDVAVWITALVTAVLQYFIPDADTGSQS